MSTYHGDKSLDAEIYIDLKTGDVVLDYSLNKVASRYDSNTSAELKDEFKMLPMKRRLSLVITRVPLTMLFASYSIFTTPIITFLIHRNILKSEKYQEVHQRLLQWMTASTIGTYVEVRDGALQEKRLAWHIPNNLWMQYHLDGEYRDLVKSIELKRHFVTRKRFGIYEVVRQDGWDLIFQFAEIPQSGSCTIEHT